MGSKSILILKDIYTLRYAGVETHIYVEEGGVVVVVEDLDVELLRDPTLHLEHTEKQCYHDPINHDPKNHVPINNVPKNNVPINHVPKKQCPHKPCADKAWPPKQCPHKPFLLQSE